MVMMKRMDRMMVMEVVVMKMKTVSGEEDSNGEEEDG